MLLALVRPLVLVRLLALVQARARAKVKMRAHPLAVAPSKNRSRKGQLTTRKRMECALQLHVVMTGFE